MRILCAFSGIDFEVEHFPSYLNSRESYHPIFDIPQRKLIPYLRKWSARELTDIDSYLLFLATLNSTEQIEFRVPVYRSERTPQIIANNMENLFRVVLRMNTIATPSVVFPRYVITPDTKDLRSIPYWLQNWNDIYESFINGSRKGYDDRKLAQKEALLERLIRNPHKEIKEYIGRIADWAAEAGNFPTFLTISRLNNEKMTCSDYWKQVIQACTTDVKALGIPKSDLEEILEHCETNIPIGTIHSHKLFKLLRDTITKQKNFLDIGILGDSYSKLGAGKYSLIDSSDDLENAHILNAIEQAPLEEPKKEDYPSKFKFLQAKMRWEMSRKSSKNEGAE